MTCFGGVSGTPRGLSRPPWQVGRGWPDPFPVWGTLPSKPCTPSPRQAGRSTAPSCPTSSAGRPGTLCPPALARRRPAWWPAPEPSRTPVGGGVGGLFFFVLFSCCFSGFLLLSTNCYARFELDSCTGLNPAPKKTARFDKTLENLLLSWCILANFYDSAGLNFRPVPPAFQISRRHSWFVHLDHWAKEPFL